jgi:glyoxylase-like metal-dependent hydrolase (beta-lactamase superfamily II)
MTQKTLEKSAPKADVKPYVSSPMNELERKLHYPLGETLPDFGHAIEVAPGVKWLRIGLPFALNHINLWLLRDNLDGQDGWTVVDCCIDQAESRAQWEQVFVNALEGLPIIRVIVTHMHPDHVGLAHWLCERWGVALWMSGTDYNVARMACSPDSGFDGLESAQFFAKHGLVDAASQEKLRARSNYFTSLVPTMPRSYRRMMDGNLITIGSKNDSKTWRCISGYGHAPEHIALYCESAKILIGGDMMLPRISTNVSVYNIEPESNALQMFLDSIDKFAPCAPDTLALPSHGKPFVGIHERIQQLHDHHADRLAEVRDTCSAKPSSAADVLPVMFKRELDLHQTTFAMGEVIAHLHFLWFKGELKREFCTDGIYRFAAV